MSVAKVFLASFALYFVFAAGYIDTIDADPSIETARSLWTKGTFAVENPTINNRYLWVLRTQDGKPVAYSKLGLAYVAAYLPPVLIADVLSRFGLPLDQLTRFLVSLMNGLFTAALVALLFYVGKRRGFTTKQALWLAGLTGFATALFPYAKTCQREPLQALALTMVFGFALTSRNARRPSWHFFGAGMGAAIGILTKQTFVVAAAPALAYASWEAWKSSERRANLIVLWSPVMLACATWMIFAHFAFGGAFETGHAARVHRMTGKPWSTPFLTGVYKDWFSPSWGLFTYSPILLVPLAYLLFKARKREATALDLFLVLSIALNAFFYAKWAPAHYVLGPRFLVTTIPLFALFFDRIPELRAKWVLPAAGSLSALSLMIQLLNVSVKIHHYWSMRNEAGVEIKWDKEIRETFPSHLLVNWRLFVRKLAGKEERYSASEMRFPTKNEFDFTGNSSLQGFNFWWAHLRRRSTTASGKASPSLSTAERDL